MDIMRASATAFISSLDFQAMKQALVCIPEYLPAGQLTQIIEMARAFMSGEGGQAALLHGLLEQAVVLVDPSRLKSIFAALMEFVPKDRVRSLTSLLVCLIPPDTGL